jgi:erythromycin esterase
VSKDIMHKPVRVASFVVAVAAIVCVAACHKAPPPAPLVVIPLSGAAADARDWVQSHANAISVSDSVTPGLDRSKLAAFVGDARIVGVSELSEGTREFPTIVRHVLFALADSANVRGLAIQAPMPEAMEVDRYVRSGTGDLRKLLRTLGSPRWATPEMTSLVNAIRDWNRAHADKPIDFYGFEIPTAAHAVDIVNALPDSIAGAPLKAWFRREYPCVLRDESARFGNGGRAADSTFWRQCGTVATAAVDSIVALRKRVTPARSAQLAYIEEMARLVSHHVTTGLRYLPRQDANAEHVLYLADLLGPNAKLMVWGGDVEMGRLTLDETTVQTGVALGKRLGEKFRTMAFLFGDGSLRARNGTLSRTGQPSGPTSVPIARPEEGTYEDVLSRVPLAAYWVDMRQLPNDQGGGWLKGPRSARLITELYSEARPQLFETPLQFPQYYDGILFVRHVTATR